MADRLNTITHRATWRSRTAVGTLRGVAERHLRRQRPGTLHAQNPGNAGSLQPLRFPRKAALHRRHGAGQRQPCGVRAGRQRHRADQPRRGGQQRHSRCSIARCRSSGATTWMAVCTARPVIDLAIEAGAKLVICINSMVPLNATHAHPNENYISEHGLPAMSSTRRCARMLHSSLRYHIKNSQEQIPRCRYRADPAELGRSPDVLLQPDALRQPLLLANMGLRR
jgi:hypothetical protein